MRLRILLTASTLVLLASCSRQTDTTTNTTTPTTSAVLAAVYETESFAANADTLTRTLINYDNQGRISNFTYTEYDSVSGAAGFNQRFVFNYRTAQDSLAYYTTDLTRNTPNSLGETIHRYFTRTNGVLVKDSAMSDINPYFQDITTYTRSAGQIGIFRDGFTYEQDARYYQQYNSNGDITRQVDTLHTIGFGAGESFLRNEWITTYRSEANPFYAAKRPIDNGIIPYDWTVDTWFIAPAHLPAQRTLIQRQWSPGQPDQVTNRTVNYAYSFDAASRPVRITATSSDGIVRYQHLNYY
ncbi:MAG: hypothetical protein EOO15_03565 [Chitinophagaceae bacterium]|nr:MAG: hypothetical protein EOO15_03565 [Chitinophagaceae bacterium]